METRSFWHTVTTFGTLARRRHGRLSVWSIEEGPCRGLTSGTTPGQHICCFSHQRTMERKLLASRVVNIILTIFCVRFGHWWHHIIYHFIQTWVWMQMHLPTVYKYGRHRLINVTITGDFHNDGIQPFQAASRVTVMASTWNVDHIWLRWRQKPDNASVGECAVVDVTHSRCQSLVCNAQNVCWSLSCC